MSDQPIITIRRHVTESGKHGWRWTCRLCRAAGMHHLDRFTDRVLARYGKQDAHPQQRCIEAAERHVCRTHRAPTVVHVHVHVGGAP